VWKGEQRGEKTKEKKMNKKKLQEWEPSEEDFDLADRVLQWMITWIEQNDPAAEQSIEALQAARSELPENVEELESV
jgi:hypothetical protein